MACQKLYNRYKAIMPRDMTGTKAMSLFLDINFAVTAAIA